MRKRKLLTTLMIMAVVFIAGCSKDHYLGNDLDLANSKAGLAKKALVAETVPIGSASTFGVLAGTTITNSEESIIDGDIGVSPGTAITGFEPEPINTIEGPGTVTAGLGIVTGTIYAGGPVAEEAQADAVIAYNYLVAQVPDIILADVYQLDGQTFTPGIYNFPTSANLQVDGTLYLDFQGNSDALFIFQLGTTLVTMSNSNVIAINTGNENDCLGSNVWWAVGTSATIDGNSFIGTVIATTSITMTNTGNESGATNVSGRMLALDGAVTMVKSLISVCGSSDGEVTPPAKPCDFVTGGGWIDGNGKKNSKATFGVSGGIKHGKFWGQLSYNDHDGRNSVKVKSTSVTSYTVIDAVTREIKGICKINGKGSYTYTVIVKDNGEPGRDDYFSLVLSNGYSNSGTLKGGNIKLHLNCDDLKYRGDKDDHDDDDDDDDDGHKKGQPSGMKRK